MGLVRRALKLVPAVAMFAAGYYIGTVDSDEYQCVFDGSAQKGTIEYVAQRPEPDLFATLEDEVIRYD